MSLDNFRRIVRKCNEHSVELDVSIHFNAFDGSADGTETYIYRIGSAATAAAERINANIVSLGFRNRGVRTANFYVLRATESPALLVECCFCDSKRDASIYDANKMAEAIAEGILGFELDAGEKVEYPPVESIPVDGWLGAMTVELWQKVCGTTADGIVSGQYEGDRFARHTTGWDYSWHNYGEYGSELVRYVQKVLGVEVDGYYGVKTARALMSRYGVGTYREAVYELRRRLNRGEW